PRELKPEATLVYETGAGGRLEDGHNHFHFARAAEYSLRSADGLTDQGLAAKIGFCLLDSALLGRTPLNTPSLYASPPRILCRHDSDDDVVRMGLSPGWADVYGAATDFQWIDVSETKPGPYKIRAVVDPDDLVFEQDEDNGWGDIDVIVPGYVPEARAVARKPDGLPYTFGLSSQAFQAVLGTREDRDDVEPIPLAPPEYKLIRGPSRGTVDLPTEWVSSPKVVYTPDAGSNAADSFTYAVREAGASFPREPFVATAAIAVDAEKPQPVIAIGGAPQQMIAGSSVDLTSTPVTDDWTASGGSISREGRFVAPAEIPESGEVTITAVSADGALDRRTIRIIRKPRPEPAPAPPVEVRGATRGEPLVPAVAPNPFVPPTPIAILPRTAALGRVSAVRIGRFVAVSVNAGQPGRLAISLRKGTRKIKGCIIDVRAGAAHTCRIRRPRDERSALKVVVSMRKSSGGTITRTLALKAPPRARASAHRH
ncbi:MAG: hypothetical protein AVDCRST_MAG85-1473, partial [uncultured Solirubrobacteraceae bacterium]